MTRRPRQASRTRACEECGEVLLIAARGLCRKCYSSWRYRTQDPKTSETREKKKERTRRAYALRMQDPVYAAKHREYLRKYNERPDVRARAIYASKNAHTLKKFGMTVEQRDEMLRRQGGICLLCAARIEFKRGAAKDVAHVDHCHDSGRVRGILCAQCNTALGKLGDTVSALERVTRYLKGEL